MNSSSESMVCGGVLAFVSGVVGRVAFAIFSDLICFAEGSGVSELSIAFLFRV